MRADILALDRKGEPILAVEVKSRPITSDVEATFRRSLRNYRPHPPYAMLFDPQDVRLYSWDGRKLTLLSQLDAQPVLRQYDPDISKRRLYEDYLTSLAEAWLRDLAYHWKSNNPPGAVEFRELGLVEKLEGGTTRREAAIRGTLVP